MKNKGCIQNVVVKRKLQKHDVNHRRKLIRWIYEVCTDFQYSNYTYATAIIIFDKFTEKVGFYMSEYQLIGITSLFIAAKIEESSRLGVSEYFVITDGSCTEKEILNMELQIITNIESEWTFELPHVYFREIDMQSSFLEYDIDVKKIILECILAGLMERNRKTNNMIKLYSEGIREMKKITLQKKVSEDIKFYFQASLHSNMLKNYKFFF